MSVVRFRDLKLDAMAFCRYWDLAATRAEKGRDPDWTAGCLLGVTIGEGVARGEFYILDVRRIRDTPARVEDFLWSTHEHDDLLLDRPVPVRMEMEGGASGKSFVDQLGRGRFSGVDFKGIKPKGSKMERAKPAAIAAERGNVHLVEGAWHEDFLSEIELVPDSTHDDQCDAFSGAFTELARQVRTLSGIAVATIPKGASDDELEVAANGGWQVSL